MSAYVFSQTILDLPIKTTYVDHPAILISEKQMDDINILFLKNRLLGASISSLEMQLLISKNTIEQLREEISALTYRANTLEQINKNEVDKSRLTQQKLNTLIEYYKEKKSPKFRSYLIGFLAGATVGVVVLTVL